MCLQEIMVIAFIILNSWIFDEYNYHGTSQTEKDMLSALAEMNGYKSYTHNVLSLIAA